ncbi:MAG: hypothetical protein E7537_03865 [Ruminococcaceae bacterium]|nr:hypothetical protein [Oscillospiraceae bacterium]
MRSFFRVLSVILLVCWMTFIFFLSNQNADASSQTSGQVIEVLAEKFYPEFEQMTEPQKQEVISSLQFVVRKSAHVGMFAVLGLLSFLTFISYVDLRFFTRTFWAVAVSVLYAATDEYHQRFVGGRSCELRDFLIDTAGILAAVLLCTAFVKIIGPLRRKTAYAGVSKKALKELNYELYEKLDAAEFRNQKLKNKISEHKQTIEKLELQLQLQETVAEPKKPSFEQPLIEIEKSQENSEETCEVVEEIEETEVLEVAKETEITEMKLDDQMNYAAKVIGECVVEVTKVCNKLTVSSNDETQKELVNLALGRCEVSKSEILKIISSDMTFDQKKNLIENERKETFDYFDSIMAQMC